MDSSDQPWDRAGGSVIAGAVFGVVTGILTMLLPLYLAPDVEDAGFISIGATTVALVAGVTLGLLHPDQRRTFFGFFWGVVAGGVLVVLFVLWALSQIGS
jgi:hypothetical protein